ncbi:purine nucleoside phosphorylase [Clostridia bacterium]|nr:purine nucleoside phosphorylase [Clostridia bacterium]
MSTVYEKLQQCYENVRLRTDFTPKIALILGSGLGSYGEQIQIEESISYRDIEGFPISTVTGHEGRFLFGYVNGVPIVAMQGRVHYYEGYSMTDVVLPVRLMGLLGAKILFLTNASGGVNLTYQAGDFMLIKGQISSFVPSPLIGANVEELGVRFPDMSEIYRKDLRDIITNSAKKLDIPLQEGIYLQFTGPAYESPEEIKMAALLGADVVGMSTACEAIAANHMGLKVCGISCVTNLASGISKNPLTHEEVKETGERVAPLFQKLVTECIVNLEKSL